MVSKTVIRPTCINANKPSNTCSSIQMISFCLFGLFTEPAATNINKLLMVKRKRVGPFSLCFVFDFLHLHIILFQLL